MTDGAAKPQADGKQPLLARMLSWLGASSTSAQTPAPGASPVARARRSEADAAPVIAPLDA